MTGAVVEGRVVVELKSMEKLAPVHSKQVLTSLRLMIVEPVNALSRQHFIWLGLRIPKPSRGRFRIRFDRQIEKKLREVKLLHRRRKSRA